MLIKIGDAHFSGLTPRLEKILLEALVKIPVPNKRAVRIVPQPTTGMLWWKKTPPPKTEILEFDNSDKKFEKILRVRTVDGGRSIEVTGYHSEEGYNWVESDPVLLSMERVFPLTLAQAAALGCDLNPKSEKSDWTDGLFDRRPKTFSPPNVWWGTKEDVDELISEYPHLCGQPIPR